MLARSVGLSLQVLTSPWKVAVQVLSWCAGQVFLMLSFVGIMPVGFLPRKKFTELSLVLEHMHSREDSYRAAIRDLQEELANTSGDRRRILRRLKQTTSEMGLLSQRLEMAGDTKAEGELAALPGSRLGLHVSMAMMALAVWWFYTQEHAAVQRKLTFSILFPLVWLYTSALNAPSPVASGCIYGACWFLIGFVSAHRFSVGSYS
ncbi:hypothetical protein H632_c311p1 [Helicosporidium sp. ATCC 50920]|nr:hypothetical protein H632_c311p1 [Helicosporidium sp. ATCC 50920]|eukprot:KDD76217.1 hypothetical protein H632_c311p1 [Helicosporidium sp. ATCC 50920]